MGYRDAYFIMRQPLTGELLTRAYEALVKTYDSTTEDKFFRVDVEQEDQSDEWLQFDYAEALDDVLGDLQEGEIIEIYAEPGQRFFAHADYSSFYYGDLAIRHFPLQADVLVSNTVGLTMSIEEVLWRLDHGVEGR